MLDNCHDDHLHEDQDPYGWDKLTPRVLKPWEEDEMRMQPHQPLGYRVMLIRDAAEQLSGLTTLIRVLNECITSPITGLACTWDTRALGEPYLRDIGHTALVMRLPAELEPYLSMLIRSVPSDMNIESLDRLHCVTTWCWEVPDLVQVHLDAETIRDVMRVCAPRRPSPTLVRSLLPVVIVAGDSVAMGGLAVSKDWDESLGLSQSSSGSNWNPHRIYDEDELREAQHRAREHGAWPFLGKLWHCGGEAERPYMMLPYFRFNEI